jgi:hypothetical protein
MKEKLTYMYFYEFLIIASTEKINKKSLNWLWIRIQHYNSGTEIKNVSGSGLYVSVTTVNRTHGALGKNVK